MSIHQNEQASGARPISYPQVAGSTHSMLLVAQIGTALTAATDVFEIGQLPANCQLIDAEIVAENLAAGTVSLGFMTGRPGDANDTSRDAAAEIFSAAAYGTATRASIAALADLDVSQNNRGLGLKFSANQSAQANRRVVVKITFAT